MGSLIVYENQSATCLNRGPLSIPECLLVYLTAVVCLEYYLLLLTSRQRLTAGSGRRNHCLTLLFSVYPAGELPQCRVCATRGPRLSDVRCHRSDKLPTYLIFYSWSA